MSMKNNFPIYIVSKGRYKRRYTADMLEEMGLDSDTIQLKDPLTLLLEVKEKYERKQLNSNN